MLFIHIKDIEVTVLNEVVHLEEIINDLNKTTNETSLSPHITSIKIEQVIKDIKICPEFLQTIQQLNNSDKLQLNDKIDVIIIILYCIVLLILIFILNRVNHLAPIRQSHVNLVCVV
jgi:hypothetical protein